MSEENQNLKIGVGVMIFKDGKVLIGKRKNRHGDGEYSFCGGGLDYMQSFEDCAKQEVLEEAGIKIKNIKPEISVLMPIYNGEKYLKEAIDSILSQTFTNFELIAINDGSKDNSLEMLKSYKDPRLIIINNPINKGLIGSLNIGLDKCRGKYTARFDQDDICFEDCFQTQYDFMEKHLDIDLVGGWTECIDSNGNSLKISRNPENTWVIRYELIFNNVMFAGVF